MQRMLEALLRIDLSAAENFDVSGEIVYEEIWVVLHLVNLAARHLELLMASTSQVAAPWTEYPLQ